MSPKVRSALRLHARYHRPLQEIVNVLRLSLREVRELNDYLALTNPSLSGTVAS